MLGLAFGSFLNVCLSRWPEGESVVKPRSRCRACGRTLTWWENVPVVSWLALRGRCRTCGTWIGVRYVVVELAVGALWAIATWRFIHIAIDPDLATADIYRAATFWIGKLLLALLLIGLAFLDAEHFWLPDIITLPGIFLGCLFALAEGYFQSNSPMNDIGRGKPLNTAIGLTIGIALSAGLVLLIRWLYWLIRRKEGLGIGDAKLMAVLAVWLGLPGALLAFFIGVVIGAVMAVTMLLMPKRDETAWGAHKLPLGTFLCVGGIVSSLWGQPIIDAYLRLAGF